MPDDFIGTVFGNKSNGGLYTGLVRTTYKIIFLKSSLCVYGEYAKRRKSVKIWLISVNMSQAYVPVNVRTL